MKRCDRSTRCPADRTADPTAGSALTCSRACSSRFVARQPLAAAVPPVRAPLPPSPSPHRHASRTRSPLSRQALGSEQRQPTEHTAQPPQLSSARSASARRPRCAGLVVLSVHHVSCRCRVGTRHACAHTALFAGRVCQCSTGQDRKDWRGARTRTAESRAQP